MSEEKNTWKSIPRTTRHRWRKRHGALTDAEFDWIKKRCIETETILRPAILDRFGQATGSMEERWKAALLAVPETTARRRSAGGTVVKCPCCGHMFTGG